MGLFSKSSKTSMFPWVEITSTNELNAILQNIAHKPVLLFKHSARCSISSMALNNFERNWKTGTELCELYFIDLLKHRDVSNLIAELTGVQHQSPQAIVLKRNEVVYDASHSGIDVRSIEKSLTKS